jgi:hypothetical protein
MAMVRHTYMYMSSVGVAFDRCVRLPMTIPSCSFTVLVRFLDERVHIIVRRFLIEIMR